MSVFVPFRAIRPRKDLVESISSKPYDVLNKIEARKECEGNPLSYYHVTKPEIDFHDDYDPFAPEVYQKGIDRFEEMVSDGLMVKDEEELFYVYRLIMNGREQTGLVGCCSIDDYFNNVIKKHELTKPHIEDDRKQHILRSQVNYEPVFFTYPKVDEISEIINQTMNNNPENDFTSEDGVRHTLWLINETNHAISIKETFDKEIPKLYIADGHHRTAAGAKAGKDLRMKNNSDKNGLARYNYFMAVLFSDDQMNILDYNRVVKDLNGLDKTQFLDELRSSFEIEHMDSAYRPERADILGMYLNNQWYKITAKPGTFDPNDPVEQLGFTILSKNILDPILNIVDLRRDKRIDFVGGIRGLGELERRVQSGEMKLAFAVHPINIHQLIHFADHDLVLPPKVTWFEPKLRSGLFVHDLKD